MSSDIHQHDSGEPLRLTDEQRAAARRTVARHALDVDDLETLLDALNLRPKGTS